ncbi:MAG: hypothetical protein EAZ92_02220 [Candidatus Kapaibacterium sp.]|nr:MAG: hypothetical protein EAZ92_02220 [Candidatus Kapabacteria bacterium]
MIRPRYEFDKAQNAIITGLAMRLNIIGLVCFIVGAGVVLMMFVRHGNLNALLIGGLSLIFGALAIYAGQAFKRITTTQDHDIDHLIEALQTLTRVYNVQVAAILLGAIALGYSLWESLK